VDINNMKQLAVFTPAGEARNAQMNCTSTSTSGIMDKLADTNQTADKTKLDLAGKLKPFEVYRIECSIKNADPYNAYLLTHAVTFGEWFSCLL
jgi:hypothetical protein